MNKILPSIRALMPHILHTRYAELEKMRIEYEPSADCFRATLWFYWTWKNKMYEQHNYLTN